MCVDTFSFNNISTFVGYKMPNEVHAFSIVIKMKVNAIVRLEVELAYLPTVVQNVSHYTTETIPWIYIYIYIYEVSKVGDRSRR